MELVVALGLALAFAWLIGSIGAQSLDRGIAALAQFVGGWRPDGWPRGVQEEDRDRPWGRPARQWLPALKSPDLKPTLHKVHGAIGHR